MTAKETFIASTDAKPFSEMVSNPVFQRAMHYGLLSFLESQPKNPNPMEYDPAALVQGALKFKTILENLSKPAEQPEPFKEPFRYEVYERTRRTNT